MATDLMNQSGIARVIEYTASPVECCDRCSAGIKNVFVVVYRDGFRAKFGSECIRKMLAQAPDMWALFNKNSKLLVKYQEYVSILSGPVDQMPRGSEYFGSGLYFIADSKGKDIAFKNWFFHPNYDVAKNASGNRYVVYDPAEKARKDMAEIERGLAGLRKEIERIELFLARVLAKSQAQKVTSAR